MARLLRIALALALLSAPLSASAYLLPEDVLEDDGAFMPPTNAEAPKRVRAQQKESAERREREQERIFATQHPPQPTEENTDDTPVPSSPWKADREEDASDAEVLRAARILARVERQQEDIYGSRGVLRGRAPMVDTGPATLLAIIPIAVAAGWTWRRAGKRQ